MLNHLDGTCQNLRNEEINENQMSSTKEDETRDTFKMKSKSVKNKETERRTENEKKWGENDYIGTRKMKWLENKAE